MANPPVTRHRLVHVALVVRDYDEAIAFYTEKLGFTLVEDTWQPEQDKRWVVVAPAGSSGATLLLARASTPEQATFIGNQAGGRVFLFLGTDDFWRDYHRMLAVGVKFVRPPSEAAYGTVAVFEDLYGNRWDLVQYRADESPRMDFDLAEGIAVLERTPHTLRAMLAGLPPVWTEADEGPGTWSPWAILGHLIHGEQTDWIARAELILAQGAERRFTPFDREAQFRESLGKSLGELLDEFERVRAANLKTVAGWRLTSAQLALTGEHPTLGTVTLRNLLATWVAHDLAHIAQTARVMAKQYREAVGPWREYLPVMDR